MRPTGLRRNLAWKDRIHLVHERNTDLSPVLLARVKATGGRATPGRNPASTGKPEEPRMTVKGLRNRAPQPPKPSQQSLGAVSWTVR